MKINSPKLVIEINKFEIYIAVIDETLENKFDLIYSHKTPIIDNQNKIINFETIYNNLNELAEKGILRKFYVNNDKMWFDTNLQDHYHFYDAEKDELIDIDKSEISFSKSPKIPTGKVKDSINIIINLKNKN